MRKRAGRERVVVVVGGAQRTDRGVELAETAPPAAVCVLPRALSLQQGALLPRGGRDRLTRGGLSRLKRGSP